MKPEPSSLEKKFPSVGAVARRTSPCPLFSFLYPISRAPLPKPYQATSYCTRYQPQPATPTHPHVPHAPRSDASAVKVPTKHAAVAPTRARAPPLPLSPPLPLPLPLPTPLRLPLPTPLHSAPPLPPLTGPATPPPSPCAASPQLVLTPHPTYRVRCT